MGEKCKAENAIYEGGPKNFASEKPILPLCKRNHRISSSYYVVVDFLYSTCTNVIMLYYIWK